MKTIIWGIGIFAAFVATFAASYFGFGVKPERNKKYIREQAALSQREHLGGSYRMGK